jgi:hypothetical protein
MLCTCLSCAPCSTTLVNTCTSVVATFLLSTRIATLSEGLLVTVTVLLAIIIMAAVTVMATTSCSTVMTAI